MSGPEQRSRELVQMVRRLVSIDPEERSDFADEPARWTLDSALDQPQQSVVGMVCLWTWAIEPVPEVVLGLLDSITSLMWSVPSRQVLGVVAKIYVTSAPTAERTFLRDLDDFAAEHPDVVPRLLGPEECRRAVDLVRGITSAVPDERLTAARLAADVVASRSLADEEAACFAGLLGYAVVVETRPEVRRAQAAALAAAARNGRLSDDHRDVALTADLPDDEAAAIREHG